MKLRSFWSYAILLFAILIVIVHHVFGYIGHYGYDDLHYASLAHDLSRGALDYSNHYAFRITLIFLTSISYSLFGISDFASSLPSILITIATLILVFFALRQQGNLTLIIGLSITVLSQWLLFYSDKLMPDIYIVFSAMLTLFIVDFYKYRSNKKNAGLYAFFLSLALLFGFASKETIILLLPLFIYLLVLDIYLRRDIKFWIYSFLYGVILLSIYFLVIWIITGDIASRFKAIAGGGYLNSCSYDKQSFIILLRRIGYQFVGLLSNYGMLGPLIFVFAFLFQKKIRGYFLANDSFSFYFVSAIILFLASNFMSISLKAYVPMCLDPRHYLFLIPISAIPASIIINRFIFEKKYAWQIIAGLFLLTVFSHFQIENSFSKLYLLIFLLFALHYFITRKLVYEKIIIIIFIFILMMPLYWMIRYAGRVKYNKQKEIIYKYVIGKKEDCYVITNDVQHRLGNYYTAFDKNSKCKFLCFGEFDMDTLDKREKILVLNSYTEYLSGLDINDFPYYAKDTVIRDSLVYKNNDLNISVYRLSDKLIQARKETIIFHSKNDFEKPVQYWNQSESDISGLIKYKGNNSNKVNEYSSTLKFPLDSLHLDSNCELMIACKLYCYFEDKTAAKLVISISDEKSVYLWKAMEVNKYLKAYSNWWPVKFEINLNSADIKPNSLLIVYLWNVDKRKAFIDNVETTIKRIGN